MCYTYGFSHMTSRVEILCFLHVEYMGLCTYGIHVDLYTWNAYGFAHVKTIWKKHKKVTQRNIKNLLTLFSHSPVSSVGRAWESESEGRGFEPHFGRFLFRSLWKMPSGIHVEYMCTLPYWFCHMYTICIQLEKTWKSYGIQVYTTWFRARKSYVYHMVLYTWKPDGTICIPHVFHMVLLPGSFVDI